jgi:hypothetical protein
MEDEGAVREELMRQIAEFVAVLSRSLFTGAAVYVSLVEHPARMQCGVEIAATEFPTELSSRHCHASNLGNLGAAIVHIRMAFRGDILVAGWRDRARLRHTIHSDRDPAHQQAVAQPDTG